MEHLDISTTTCEQGLLEGYLRVLKGLSKVYSRFIKGLFKGLFKSYSRVIQGLLCISGWEGSVEREIEHLRFFGMSYNYI